MATATAVNREQSNQPLPLAEAPQAAGAPAAMNRRTMTITEAIQAEEELHRPLSVLPVEGDGRRFYVMSRRPEVGWLAVFIGDDTHCPTCECEHHVNRLRGTRRRCAHLEAAHQWRRQHAMSCLYCGGVMETRLERREAGLLIVAVCEECGRRKTL